MRTDAIRDLDMSDVDDDGRNAGDIPCRANDGCATYYPEHTVTRLDDEGGEVPVGNLHEGDVIRDFGQMWRVNAVARHGNNIHLDLESAE
jgi:hypothetical protein